MFDTCHPEMRGEHIAQAAWEERPDVIALSFLSTTTYPAVKNLANPDYSRKVLKRGKDIC
jgi:hypothetical protein